MVVVRRKIATPQSLLHGPDVPNHSVLAILTVPLATQRSLSCSANSHALALGWDLNSCSVRLGTGEELLYADRWSQLVLSRAAALQGGDRFLLLWTVPLTYH